MTKTRITRGVHAVLGAAVALAAGCGGEDDFPNDPRPPVPLQLSGVITQDRVNISPDKFGAGPVVILISNQTDASRTIRLSGKAVDDVEIAPEQVGPVNPLDTATIKKTLPEGDYRVAVEATDEEEGLLKQIEPAKLRVGSSRPSGSNRLLLP